MTSPSVVLVDMNTPSYSTTMCVCNSFSKNTRVEVVVEQIRVEQFKGGEQRVQRKPTQGSVRCSFLPSSSSNVKHSCPCCLFPGRVFVVQIEL